MYERMTDKTMPPEITAIQYYIGETGWTLIQEFETLLSSRYDLNKELRFPFGKSYGWGFKYAHKTKHLCYLFFEKGAVTVTLQIGDSDVPKLEAILPTLSETANLLWKNRYPCGDNGGWVHFRILSKDDLENVIKMIEVRKKPLRKFSTPEK